MALLAETELSCDTLYNVHVALVSTMSFVMLGQNTVRSALAVIPDTPWCALCKTASICLRNLAGTTTLVL